ncbi:MAG: hypothetical protein EWM47_13355, partial [Anaerolineaceae bacterium]
MSELNVIGRNEVMTTSEAIAEEIPSVKDTSVEAEADIITDDKFVEEEGLVEDADEGNVDDAYIDPVFEEGDYIDPGFVDEGYIDPGYYEGGYMEPGMET